MIRIWALAGVISVVAPVFAGLASRATLLVRAGFPLSSCAATSIRQVWVSLEHALILGGLATLLSDIPGSSPISAALLLAAAAMLAVRIATRRDEDKLGQGNRWLTELRKTVPLHAHPLFLGQLAAMSLSYYLVFNGLGASLQWDESILLAALTAVTSTPVAIPNGLGLLDGIWILVASRSGLGLDQSVALAVLLRLGYFTAAVSLWSSMSVLRPQRHRNVGRSRLAQSADE
jgi:uncharacterized membrane protein YbhN (UPF0104 family)